MYTILYSTSNALWSRTIRQERSYLAARFHHHVQKDIESQQTYHQLTLIFLIV